VIDSFLKMVPLSMSNRLFDILYLISIGAIREDKNTVQSRYSRSVTASITGNPVDGRRTLSTRYNSEYYRYKWKHVQQDKRRNFLSYSSLQSGG
jgi:hypothetical protein